MIFFKVNSKTLSKNPSSITHSKTKIQNNDRALDGTMVIDIIAIKNIVNVGWDFLTDADMKKLSAEVSAGNFVSIDYWDNETESPGMMKNILAVAENFTFSPIYNYTTSSIVWKDVKISFVEG